MTSTSNGVGVEPLRCAGPPVRDLTCLAWSVDDRRLFGGTRAGQIVVWDTRTGERRQTLAVGNHVVSLVGHGSGVVVELLDFVRLMLTWRVAIDGVLEELTWSTAPLSTQCERLSVSSHAGDRHVIHRDGRIQIWPVEGTEGWWLGRLRALTAGDRAMPSLGERGKMRDELVRCDVARHTERGLVVASQLLLLDDSCRGMAHVARGLFCHDLGDPRGELFELWEAERLRRAGELSLAIKHDVLQALGRGTHQLERAIAAGQIDPDDWRLANVASRAYGAAFDAMQRGCVEQALLWIVDALIIRPQAVTWFYAGKLLAARREYEHARWCLDHIERCPATERALLMRRIDPAYLDALRASCAEIADRLAS
ncbi:MAG: hypothetical protein WKG01_26280 [Kofleriaceae bacterium]